VDNPNDLNDVCFDALVDDVLFDRNRAATGTDFVVSFAKFNLMSQAINRGVESGFVLLCLLITPGSSP
jgi:hypothetical protein